VIQRVKDPVLLQLGCDSLGPASGKESGKKKKKSVCAPAAEPAIRLLLLSKVGQE